MQIDKKTMNYIKKSIEIHLNILNENKILLESEKSKEHIQDSIKHLENVLNILNEKEFLEKKRVVYGKYIKMKKEYMTCSDSTKKVELEKEMNTFLKYYLTLKELCSIK